MLFFPLLERSCTSRDEKSILDKGHSLYIIYRFLSKFPYCFNLTILGRKWFSDRHPKQKDNNLRVCCVNIYYIKKMTSFPVPVPHILLLSIIRFPSYSLSVLSGVLLTSYRSLFFSFSLATFQNIRWQPLETITIPIAFTLFLLELSPF